MTDDEKILKWCKNDETFFFSDFFLSFSDNNLQNEGIRHIADVLAKLQNLVSVKYVALKLYLNIKVVDYSCFYFLFFCAGWDEITLPWKQQSVLLNVCLLVWTSSRLMQSKKTHRRSVLVNLGRHCFCVSFSDHAVYLHSNL